MNSNTILHLVASSGAAHLVDALLRIEGYSPFFLDSVSVLSSDHCLILCTLG